MSNYRTASRNFINRFTEQTYSPDEQLIKRLHAYLDMVSITNEQLALAIDMVVAELMRVEGYGMPQSQVQALEPEIYASKSTNKRKGE